MARPVETFDLAEGVQLSCQPLPFEKAEDLLPEVAQIVGNVFDAVAPLLQSGEISAETDVMKLLPVLGPMAGQLAGGRLKRLAPKLLECSSIIMPNSAGEKLKYDLCKKEEYQACFDERPDVYFPALWHAGRATFGRFFSGAGRRQKPPAKTE